MDAAFDAASVIQQALGAQERIGAAVDGEAGEFPFDDPCKPHERAHVEEADGTEALLTGEYLLLNTLINF